MVVTNRGQMTREAVQNWHGSAAQQPISKLVTLVAVIVPPLGLLSAIGLLWGVGVHAVDLVLLGEPLRGLCLRDDDWVPPLLHASQLQRARLGQVALAILGCMTMQGPITQWVSDHRKHHALSDKPGDPHSPHAGHGDGLLPAIRGFLHAHVGWLFSNLGMEQGRAYAKDLYDDRVIRWIDRLYLAWVGLTLGIPFAIGYLVGGTWQAGVEGLVWGGLIRIFLYQHATFSVNSICHMFGRRDFDSRDESRNNWFVAALVFGEGWHNNHHAFPASARHGLLRFQVDISWLVIRGLERLGLVWDVHVPNKVQLARRQNRAHASAGAGGPPQGSADGERTSPRSLPQGKPSFDR